MHVGEHPGNGNSTGEGSAAGKDECAGGTARTLRSARCKVSECDQDRRGSQRRGEGMEHRLYRPVGQ